VGTTTNGGGARKDAPVTNALHLLDLPAERLAVKISQGDRVLAVDFKMRDCVRHNVATTPRTL